MTVPDLQTYLPELLLRGASCGILLLAAVHFGYRGSGFGVARIGALFFVGTAAYTIVSTPVAGLLDARIRPVLIGFATLNSVFFWWFATALFDDTFRWRVWRLVPFVLFAGLYTGRLIAPGIFRGEAFNILQQIVVMTMMLHALGLALIHRKDDLIEPRRRFRLAFAVCAGLMGLAIAIAELWLGGDRAPIWLTMVHASVLFALTLAFTVWILRPVELFSERTAPARAEVPDEDGAAAARLERAMEAGAHRREGLTVKALADQVGLPEYRLRQLINRSLGYRNFTAFLNHYRLSDARRMLSDPDKARLQITQVALDLGYASIGPFNRAFKEAEGMTPSEYRKRQFVRNP